MAVDSTGCPNQPAVAGNRVFANLSQVCKTLFQVVVFFDRCADGRPLRSSEPPPQPLPSYMHLDIQALATADLGICKRVQPLKQRSRIGGIYAKRIHTKHRIVDMQISTPIGTEPGLEDAQRADCSLLRAIEQKVEEHDVPMIHHA